jgi:hypothetical protein
MEERLDEMNKIQKEAEKGFAWTGGGGGGRTKAYKSSESASYWGHLSNTPIRRTMVQRLSLLYLLQSSFQSKMPVVKGFIPEWWTMCILGKPLLSGSRPLLLGVAEP